MEIHFLDRFSIGVLFVMTVMLMLFMLELGYRFGHSTKTRKVKAQTAQVRALMGATLGLLAFMLAFTFSTAQSHYEKRIELQVREAMLARAAFMKADLIGEPLRSRARELLMEYVEGRVHLLKMVRDMREQDIFSSLARAKDLQLELWSVGKDAAMQQGPEPGAGEKNFASSVLGLMDLDTQRTQTALSNRIPIIIWLTLYFTAVMSMVVVGYQAGLTEKRSPVATISLAFAFAAVMMLIMDLDRPLQSMFGLDVTVMEQLAVFMRQQL